MYVGTVFFWTFEAIPFQAGGMNQNPASSHLYGLPVKLQEELIDVNYYFFPEKNDCRRSTDNQFP